MGGGVCGFFIAIVRMMDKGESSKTRGCYQEEKEDQVTQSEIKA